MSFGRLYEDIFCSELFESMELFPSACFRFIGGIPVILQLLFAGNIREIGAYEKARFVREGLLRQAAHIDGQWVDVVPMGFMLDVVCMARVRGLDD